MENTDRLPENCRCYKEERKLPIETPTWVVEEIKECQSWTKQKRKSVCRFYGKNGKGCNDKLFSEYEKYWVDDPVRLEYTLCEYIANGLTDFAKDDGTPVGLKALLYNRWDHWSMGGTPESFKQWYKENYCR